MITGNMLVMFIVGFIIFCFYIGGLLYAIYWGHTTQREEMRNDIELQNYYNRHHNYDGDIDWTKSNPHSKEDSYVREIFKKKNTPTKGKENVGKSTYWD